VSALEQRMRDILCSRGRNRSVDAAAVFVLRDARNGDATFFQHARQGIARGYRFAAFRLATRAHFRRVDAAQPHLRGDVHARLDSRACLERFAVDHA
jgi:hypothetical protein